MSNFNIRVYALFINDANQVLVTDEFRFGKEMTKFPGGGLNWGEGTMDCLKRECREELGCDIEIIRHYYTTDYFQQAAFYENQQLMSIYYLVKNTTPFLVKHLFKEKHDPKHIFTKERTEDAQSFRWVSISIIKPEEFTFPIDKIVAGMLQKGK